MKAPIYIFFILCLLFVSVSAKEPGRIDVLLAAEKVMSTLPGNVISAPITVSNNTRCQHDIITNAVLPQQWKLISDEPVYQLSPGQSSVKLLSFYVPQGANVGKYNIYYIVRSKSSQDYQNACQLQIIVQPFFHLRTEVITAPEYVIAGEKYQVTFLAANESNASDKISAHINSSHNYPFTYSIKGLDNNAIQAKLINITVQTDKDCQQSFIHKVQLTTQSKIHHAVESEATSKVRIIPRVSGFKDRFYRLPLTIAIGEFMQKSETVTHGYQADIKGEGALDKEGEKRVQFQLRGPDVYERSILARRDEYFASYWTKNLEFHLGDRIYQLSTLTERARYGRGAESKININNFSIGSYYLKARWQRPINEELACYLRYHFAGNQAIGFNYLKKHSVDGKNDLVSLATKIYPFADSEIELEYSTEANKKRKADSYLASIQGRKLTFDYFFKWIHASPDFLGFYRKTDFFSSNLDLTLLKNLSFNANFRSEKQNYDLDTLRYAAPLIQYIKTGFKYCFHKNTHIDFAFQKQAQKDRFEVPKFNYREISFRFGISHNFGKLSLMVNAEIGKTNNYLTNQIYAMRRYTFNSRFNPSERLDFNGYFYYNNYSWFSGEKTHRLTAGIKLSVLLFNNLSFFLNFQNHYSPEEIYFDRNVFATRLIYSFANKHQIYVQARQTLQRYSLTATENAVMLGYMLPLSIPIRKKDNIGVIKGKVYDVDSGQPVKDLILNVNGALAVTDKKGNFIFPSLVPQSYYLTMDKSKIGLDKVTLQKYPIEVHLDDGQVVDLTLNITQGSTCAGRIIITSSEIEFDSQTNVSNNKLRELMPVGLNITNEENKEKSKELSGLPNISIELKRNGEVLKTVTDSKGCFEFRNIRPGEWIMQLDEKNLPPYYKFEATAYRVLLDPGAKKISLIKAIPQKRRIQMQQEGEALIVENSIELDKKQKAAPAKKDGDHINEYNMDLINRKYQSNLDKFQQRKYSEALTGFQELLLHYPQHALACNFRYWTGECYYALREYHEAFDAFQSVLQSDCYFKHDDALLMCGIVCKRLKK